jgi:hypothetical protein
MPVSPFPLAALVVLVLLPSLASAAAERVSDFRVKMEKWVETRQIISEERSEWIAEQDTLRATRDLLAQQKQALASEIEELETSSTAADEERRELLLVRGDHQRGSQALREQIRAMEEQVLGIAPQLPEPLQDKLEVLLVQIPEGPEAIRLAPGQRLMNVLGVLAQAEKWNGTATFVGETRAVEGGEKVQLRTLYWGLAGAIYVDARGEVAGVGRPGPDGWVFASDPEIADEARRLLDIYEGNIDAIEFVALPAEIH